MKNQRITFHLPNPVPKVELSKAMAELLEQIIKRGSRGISSLELHSDGFCAVSSKVSILKAMGAEIDTYRETAIDLKGNAHKAVAHYVYRGWRLL